MGLICCCGNDVVSQNLDSYGKWSCLSARAGAKVVVESAMSVERSDVDASRCSGGDFTVKPFVALVQQFACFVVSVSEAYFYS